MRSMDLSRSNTSAFNITEFSAEFPNVKLVNFRQNPVNCVRATIIIIYSDCESSALATSLPITSETSHNFTTSLVFSLSTLTVVSSSGKPSHVLLAILLPVFFIVICCILVCVPVFRYVLLKRRLPAHPLSIPNGIRGRQ